MLHDVDASLAAWLVGSLPSATTVTFDAPAERSVTEPVLGLYLHDVREEADAAQADWTSVRNEDGKLVGRIPPQRRYWLTYLITAWAADTLTEHRLLGEVLAVCAAHIVIPQDALRGALISVGEPLPFRCAPHEQRCDPRELWAAWRIAPRTALELSVLAALPVAMLADLPKPPRSVNLGTSRPPAGAFSFDDRRPAAPANGRARIDE